MSKLEEFERKLYKRGEVESQKRDSFKAGEESLIATKHEWERERGKASGLSGRAKKILAGLFFLFLAAIFLSAGAYYYYTEQSGFNKNDAIVNIIGSDRLVAGEEVSFEVMFKNNSKSILRDAEVVLEWPEYSVLSGEGQGSALITRSELGMIVPFQEKSVSFKGRIYGAVGDETKIKAVFRYIPENFNSPFEGSKEFDVTVVASPLALNINVPPKIAADKEVDIKLEYQNQSEANFPNSRIKIAYPSGFKFISADPAPMSDNNIWDLGSIDGRGSGVISIKGSFAGAQGEVKSLRAEIGSLQNEEKFISYASIESAVAIASSALMVFQTANGSRDFAANPGTVLKYNIKYKNTSDFQIPNGVILVQIDPALIDIKSLNISWGSFDGRTSSIIWNEVGVTDLAILDPKEEGEVSFSVKLNSVFLPKSFSDKNLKVVSIAKITSSSAPEGLKGLPIGNEDTLEVKINTQFSFTERAYFSGGLIENSGPLPPRVGEKTTYTVFWQLTNTTNDVEGVEVTAVVPPNIEWTGVIYPQDAEISYDKNSGVIKWNAGKVIAGTGILVPAKRVDFQLAFTPGLYHVGQMFNLMSGASLKGKDGFTGMDIQKEVPLVNSDLLGTLTKDQAMVTQ